MNKTRKRLQNILNHLNMGISLDTNDSSQEMDKSKNYWYALHNYPVINRFNWSMDSCKNFFDKWERGIPNRKCRCLDKWIDIKTVIDFPEKYNSPELFFKWSIDAHNEVNKKLDKPIMSYEEAKQIYGF